MSNIISKEKAYEVLSEYYHHKTEMQHKALREALDRVPPADIDLSDYSDRLWRNAYEQGKADAEAERKKGKWNTDKESPEYATCSVCGHCDWDCTESEYFNYCPNCGADMRKTDDA